MIDQELETLPRSFYSRDVLLVAKELLGKRLVRICEEGEMVGKIVEVEAYKGEGDPASHAYAGWTPRNRVLFEGPGLVYVYFVYGNHYCINVTSNEKGVVLIRALEPVKGIEIMQKNRNVKHLLDLTSGPGKLTQALNITKALYGIDLSRGKDLHISGRNAKSDFDIVSATRIGIKVAVDKPWRFYIKGNEFVSNVEKCV